MAWTVADAVIERLVAWDVRRVFGYPGDGIDGLVNALGARRDGALELVQVRHEEAASFMASAHAKATGRLGVCLATSGPGAIHLLNGLYDARMDHQPVLAIVGHTARSAIGSRYQQEVDLGDLFKDVAREFVEMVSSPEAWRHALDRAIRIALARRAPTCVILPKDVQEEAAEEPRRAHDRARSGVGFARPRVLPEERDLDRAADVLNAGTRVAILVGAGAIDAREEVAEIADRLGAGVAKALLGKAVLPDDVPWVTGAIGLLGTRPSWDLMQRCDTLLVLGSGFPYSEFLPEEGRARGVQVDLDAGMLSLRYPMEVNLVGDCARTIRALLRRLRPKTDWSWREDIEERVAAWWKKLERRAYARARSLNPQRVLWELSPRLPDRAVVVSDVGTATTWFARCVRLRAGMDATTSGGLASMGNGVPYALAQKLAQPDRPVIAVCGDGAMQMLGNAELVTVAKYASRWGRSPFVVLVLNNRDLAMVSWEQRVLEGDPKLPASQDLPDFPYATYAESIGLHGVHVEHPEDVGPAWDEALSAGRPAVLEAVVDPDVPPLPPHVTFQQASRAAAALLKGDPDAGAVLSDSWHQVVDPLLHR